MRVGRQHTCRTGIGPVTDKWLLLVLVSLALLCQLPCDAEFKPDLSASYLQNQFAYAMYIDTHDVDHYLNYAGSTLHPLTKVRIRYKYFPHDGRRPADWPAKTYDEFWYYEGKPVGLRRNLHIDLKKNDIGVIVIGQAADHLKSSLATTDALVRLLVNLQFYRSAVGAVIVPPDQYDQILLNLQHYHFFPTMPQVRGPQMKIHLRSDSGGQETYVYLHH